jgi:aminoglycoside phosphotransferase (APT) family kinase protein
MEHPVCCAMNVTSRSDDPPGWPAGRGATGTVAVPDTHPVRPDERLDAARLEAWLALRLPDVQGPLRVSQFPGGHSNLTYCLGFGSEGRELVLRRPPLGPVAPRAHDMAREYAVLSRLAAVFPLAPRAYAFCGDPSVIGAPFYLMERRRGVVVRDTWPPELPDDPGLRRRVAEGLLDALVALHDVDFAAAGLGDLGRPEGYAERQVRGWQGRWERARTRALPALDHLAARLLATLPSSAPATLVHNDFKLDNVLLDPADPGRVTTILDWEMTTLGDPLIDLGTLLGYWPEPGDPEVRKGNPSSPTTLPGFPTRSELAARYARARGLDLGAIGWYETFGLFKTAVVLEQIYVRFKRGQTQDPRFARFEERVPALLQAASLVAERSGIA